MTIAELVESLAFADFEKSEREFEYNEFIHDLTLIDKLV